MALLMVTKRAASSSTFLGRVLGVGLRLPAARVAISSRSVHYINIAGSGDVTDGENRIRVADGRHSNQPDELTIKSVPGRQERLLTELLRTQKMYADEVQKQQGTMFADLAQVRKQQETLVDELAQVRKQHQTMSAELAQVQEEKKSMSERLSDVEDLQITQIISCIALTILLFLK